MSERPTLTVGSIVQTRAPVGVQSGSAVIPALVTKVWDRTTVLGFPVWVVNLRLFFDGPDSLWRPHVYVFEDAAAASVIPGVTAWLIPSEEPRVSRD